MDRNKFRFFSPDEGGVEGASGNTPAVTPAPENTPTPTAIVEDVSNAATSATVIAEQSGEEGWKIVAEELKGLRGDINKLMKGTAKVATTKTPSEPDVDVDIPTPQERKIRRNGRKVTRRG